VAYKEVPAQKKRLDGDEEFLVIRSEQRWGTRRVEITGVDLCDQHNQIRSIFLTGTPMNIRIRYKTQERIEEPVFGIAIHHQNGTHLTGPNTHFGGLDIPYLEGEGEVVCQIPALPLLSGEYLISVASHNRADTEMFDYHDRVYRFRVHTGKIREPYGLVTLGSSWQLDPSESKPPSQLSSNPDKDFIVK
jgi:hypothetical protein